MKLLISGYYGYGNLGDEALLAGIMPTLKAKEHRINVLSGNPQESRHLHGVAATSRYLGALPALLQCDAFISGGGGLLQDKTSARSLSYYLTLLRLAKRLGKRSFVYGQSVGPLSEAGRQRVAATLQGVKVFVRDQASQDLLAALGISSRLTADGALLLEPPPHPSRHDAVLLIPRHGYPDVTDALVYVARQLRSYTIPVAATTVQPDEDKAELERLKVAVPELTVYTPSSPAELLGVIAGSSYVLSARLHGLVLAAAAGVSFSGIVYDPKVAAFLQEVRAPAFYLPVNANALLRTVLDQPDLSVEAVSALKIRARTGLDDLLSALGSP